MSSRWKSELRQFLRECGAKRVVLLGVGNTLRGDDGAGSVLARRLRARGVRCVFDAGSAPENYGERIAALAPDAVLVVDAARFGGEPGEARMLCPDEITGKGLSTHDQSLGALARYLAGRCGCGMRILGIEPASSEMDSDLSPPVKTMLDELEPFLLDYLP